MTSLAEESQKSMYKTKLTFDLAARVYSDNARRTSKPGNNTSHATRLRLEAY